jgi:hypothetical protein
MNSFNHTMSPGAVFFQRAAMLSAVLFFLLAGAVGTARAQTLSEDFNNITTLPGSGWFVQNNSAPLGTTGWFQGNTSLFSAQSGAANSYIAANYNNTTGTNTISNWLLTPTLTLRNGDAFRFWTRSPATSQFPDRLEVRLSTNGASANVGSTPTSVGDFTTLLLTINPNLIVGGYPTVWTEYVITVSGLPPGGGGLCGASPGVQGRFAFRYFVTGGGPEGDNSEYVGIDTVRYNAIITPLSSATTPARAALDYNCDGKTDYVVVRNTGGGSSGQSTWFINNGTTHTQTPWGIASDSFVSGDFDGDFKSDITVYRRGVNPGSVFYTLRSSNGTIMARQLGSTGDDPSVVGDYDGDSKTDYAVYRDGAGAGQQSFWYYLGSATVNGGITFAQWGQNGDFPAPGDYDGDGKNDFCVQRADGMGQGVFLLSKSSGGGIEAVTWGLPSDLIVPGDYDGDGRDDFAVLRASGGQLMWNVLGRQNNNVIHYGQPWGLSATDFPTQGDYDGDGRTDLAVWRLSSGSQPNSFYIRRSSNNALQAFQWGQQGDYPVANFNSH